MISGVTRAVLRNGLTVLVKADRLAAPLAAASAQRAASPGAVASTPGRATRLGFATDRLARIDSALDRAVAERVKA